MHVHPVFYTCTPCLPRCGLAEQKSDVDFEIHRFLNFLINILKFSILNIKFNSFSHVSFHQLFSQLPSHLINCFFISSAVFSAAFSVVFSAAFSAVFSAISSSVFSSTAFSAAFSPHQLFFHFISCLLTCFLI